MCGPRSLRIRMWIGFWPPSRLTLRFEPEREPAPFWPRPEVLPKPEPSPRPMRFLRWREPGFGFRLWSPIASVSSSAMSVLHPHQVLDGVDRAANLGHVGLLGAAADLAEPERPQRVALLLVGAVRGLELRDANLSVHQLVASAGSASSAAAAGVPLPPVPSTSAIDRPRSSATSSGERRF